MNYWGGGRREITLEILDFPFTTSNFAHCSPLTALLLPLETKPEGHLASHVVWHTHHYWKIHHGSFKICAWPRRFTHSSDSSYKLPSCHPSTKLAPFTNSLLSISPPCFLASRSKFLDSYYPLSFIYCPWVLLGLATEWPLDSDLPLYPHYNCSIRVLITQCLDWFISKFSSSLFIP